MLQHVNSVFVATKLNDAATDFSTVTNGDLVIGDANKTPIASTTITQHEVIYVGIVEGTFIVTNPDGTVATLPNIRWSAPIQIGGIRSIVTSDYEAKAEDVIAINFATITPVVGYHYVIRMVYKDIFEHPGQFTHQYEVIAKTTNVNDLVLAFQKKINKHPNRRINATVDNPATPTILTLTAMEKTDVSKGFYVINYYSQVSMDAFVWYTIPQNGIIGNVQYPLSGVVVTKTQGTPGKGNALVIRDHIYRSFGYRGITYRENAKWPFEAPEYNLDLAGTYDEFTMEWNNLYRSNDNQYVKNTPIALEVYSVAGANVHTDLKTFIENINA